MRENQDNNTKNIDYKKNERVKTIIKFVLIVLTLIVSFFYKYFKDGLYETIKTIIILVFCIIGGMLLFLLIYCLCYFITYLNIQKSNNKKVKDMSLTEDDIKEFIDSGKYTFNYNKELSIKNNLLLTKDLALLLVKDIFEKYNKENKYFLFDYTIYDALDIVERCVAILYKKIDNLLSSVNLQNKPLSILEKALTNLIENEEPKEKNNHTIFGKILNKVKNVGISIGVSLFKNQINECLNSVIIYTGIEAKRIYSKNKENNDKKLIKSEVDNG